MGEAQCFVSCLADAGNALRWIALEFIHNGFDHNGGNRVYALEKAGVARMSHVSIETADLERALDFYQRIFGFQAIFDREQSGAEFEAITATPGAKSRFIRGLIAGQAVVQLWWHNWREPSEDKRTLMSFEVRDVPAAYEALRAQDVVCRSEPVEFDECWAFVMADPDGHPIEIIQWKGHASPYRLAL